MFAFAVMAKGERQRGTPNQGFRDRRMSFIGSLMTKMDAYFTYVAAQISRFTWASVVWVRSLAGNE